MKSSFSISSLKTECERIRPGPEFTLMEKHCGRLTGCFVRAHTTLRTVWVCVLTGPLSALTTSSWPQISWCGHGHFVLVTSFGARVCAVVTRKWSHAMEFLPKLLLWVFCLVLIQLKIIVEEEIMTYTAAYHQRVSRSFEFRFGEKIKRWFIQHTFVLHWFRD